MKREVEKVKNILKLDELKYKKRVLRRYLLLLILNINFKSKLKYIDI